MSQEVKDEKTNKVDRTGLNDPMLLLQKSYNSGEARFVEEAISKLSLLLQSKDKEEVIEAVRSDNMILSPTLGFISTGVEWLDKYLGGGMRFEEMFIVAAQPGHGKTHTLGYIASQYIKQGLICLHATGEDKLEDVDDIYGRMLEEEHRKQLYYLDLRDGFKISSIAKALEKMIEKMETPPQFLVVDHLDCTENSGEGADWIEVGSTTTSLRALAKKYGCFVLTASQATVDFNGKVTMFRAKTGKSGPADVTWLIKNNINNELFISVGKSKGRKIMNRDFVIRMNMDTMEVNLS